jgi:hypothetical protein
MASSTTLRHVGTGPTMRTKAGAMAHRHSVASRNVAVIILCVLMAFLFFLGMVQVSNQVNGLRSHIAKLQDQQEYLEANGASLLADWNKATRCETITGRARKELGMMLSEVPALVIVRHDMRQDRSPWQNMFQGLSQSTASAAEVTENVTQETAVVVATP